MKIVRLSVLQYTELMTSGHHVREARQNKRSKGHSCLWKHGNQFIFMYCVFNRCIDGNCPYNMFNRFNQADLRSHFPDKWPPEAECPCSAERRELIISQNPACLCLSVSNIHMSSSPNNISHLLHCRSGGNTDGLIIGRLVVWSQAVPVGMLSKYLWEKYWHACMDEEWSMKSSDPVEKHYKPTSVF